MFHHKSSKSYSLFSSVQIFSIFRSCMAILWKRNKNAKLGLKLTRNLNPIVIIRIGVVNSTLLRFVFVYFMVPFVQWDDPPRTTLNPEARSSHQVARNMHIRICWIELCCMCMYVYIKRGKVGELCSFRLRAFLFKLLHYWLSFAPPNDWTTLVYSIYIYIHPIFIVAFCSAHLPKTSNRSIPLNLASLYWFKDPPVPTNLIFDVDLHSFQI